MLVRTAIEPRIWQGGHNVKIITGAYYVSGALCLRPIYGTCVVFVSIPRAHVTAERALVCQYTQRSSTRTALISGQYYFGKLRLCSQAVP